MNRLGKTSWGGALKALVAVAAVTVPSLAACGGDGATGGSSSGTTTGADGGSSSSSSSSSSSGGSSSSSSSSGSSGTTDAGTDSAAPATCTDGSKNGSESDVDCGGSCTTKCADAKKCSAAADCQSGVCDPTAKTCTPAACSDTVKNGSETDVDCGGSCTTKCADTKKCSAPADCESGVCDATAKTCTAPACNDTVKNGSEADVDCGGTCTTKCALGKACKVGADCDKAACDGTTKTCVVAKSCNEIKTQNAGAASGVYTIDPDGAGGADPFQAYCDMTNDGGGWTLAIKANGDQTTFAFSAALWTDNTLLATDKPDLDKNEAKLQSFNNLAFTNVRVTLDDGVNAVKSLVIPQASTSLYDLFTGAYAETTLGRDAWKATLTDASLQPYCNREGFNSDPAGGGWPKVRIGIVSNQENDCGSPDSWLGVGSNGAAPCGPGPARYVGNMAGCTPDNGDRSLTAFGYVWVR